MCTTSVTDKLNDLLDTKEHNKIDSETNKFNETDKIKFIEQFLHRTKDSSVENVSSDISTVSNGKSILNQQK